MSSVSGLLVTVRNCTTYVSVDRQLKNTELIIYEHSDGCTRIATTAITIDTEIYKQPNVAILLRFR
jgi:hypothetical protein